MVVSRRTGKADDLLRLAAAVERSSEHPLAEAIVEGAQGARPDAGRADGFRGHPRPRRARRRSKAARLALGNLKLMQREGIALGDLGRQAAARWPTTARRRCTSPSTARPPASSPWPTRSRKIPAEAIAALHKHGPRGRDDHRRQPPHGRGHRPAGGRGPRAGRGAAGGQGAQRPQAASWRARRSPWSATASTTRRRWRRPTSVSPSAPARTWPSRPPTSR